MSIQEKLAEAKAKLELVVLEKQLKILESANLFGDPVDVARLAYQDGPHRLVPAAIQSRTDRTNTVRSLAELHLAQQRARDLVDQNDNAAAIVSGLTSYVFGEYGSQFSVSSVDDTERKSLVKQVTKFLDEFRRVNQLCDQETEIVTRGESDGESFLRLFPDEDGVTKVRYVEPVQVRPPEGEDADGPWSWGILTPGGDTLQPMAYNVYDFDVQADEEVEAQFIIHTKHNVNANIKRGIPSFLASEFDLRGAAKLRYVAREGEMVRSAIAYARNMPLASKGTLQSLQTMSETDTIDRYNSQGQKTSVSVQQVEPGSVVDVAGAEFHDPPKSENHQSVELCLDKALQAAAARHQVPDWLVTGKTDAANYATSLTAESPFTLNIWRRQGRVSAVLTELYRRAIEIGVEQELLPANTLELVEVKVSLPNPQNRDEVKENEVYEKQHGAGILSKSGWAANVGIDYEHELALLTKERENNANPGNSTTGNLGPRPIGV